MKKNLTLKIKNMIVIFKIISYILWYIIHILISIASIFIVPWFFIINGLDDGNIGKDKFWNRVDTFLDNWMAKINQLDRKINWFNSLKPGDNILVEIFSEDCECFVQALVITPAIGKTIIAKVIVDNYSCDQCNTCWKHVTMFDIHKTKPI